LCAKVFLHGDPEAHNPRIIAELAELLRRNERGGLPDVSFVHANSEVLSSVLLHEASV